MPQVINTNIASITARRNLDRHIATSTGAGRQGRLGASTPGECLWASRPWA